MKDYDNPYRQQLEFLDQVRACRKCRPEPEREETAQEPPEKNPPVDKKKPQKDVIVNDGGLKIVSTGRKRTKK